MITVEKLTKTYGKGESRVEALRQVSFTVPDGEFTAIIGKSGSGKTTLLNLWIPGIPAAFGTESRRSLDWGILLLLSFACGTLDLCFSFMTCCRS